MICKYENKNKNYEWKVYYGWRSIKQYNRMQSKILYIGSRSIIIKVRANFHCFPRVDWQTRDNDNDKRHSTGVKSEIDLILLS